MPPPKRIPTLPKPALGRGATLGGYTIVAPLEVGGMATLYLAQPAGAPSRRLALKVAHPHLCGDEELVRLFHNEARLTALMRHRGIVEVYDIGEDAGLHYIVMEYVEGCTLARLMRPPPPRPRRFPFQLSVWIAIEVAEALHVAHELRSEHGRELGVVHRDVTPQNILISRRRQVKLTDFGIAKASDLHTRGDMRGKPAYMAPEQIHGDPIDRRADVYALGLVLWELLVGRRRFPPGDLVATLQAVVSAEPTPPSHFAPHLPRALDDAVVRAMSLDKESRFATAASFRDALAAALPEAVALPTHAFDTALARATAPSPALADQDDAPTLSRARPISGVMPSAREPTAAPPSLPRPRASLLPIVAGDRTGRVVTATQRAELELRLATFAVFGPTCTPALFVEREAALAYYLNAFITLALFSAGGAPDRGLGHRHTLDGRTIGLLELDRELAMFDDARLFAAVQRALRQPDVNRPFAADDLEERLDDAMRAFVADTNSVMVVHPSREVVLPQRAFLFSRTFEDHARRAGVGDSVLDLLLAFASPPQRDALESARLSGYELTYR